MWQSLAFAIIMWALSGGHARSEIQPVVGTCIQKGVSALLSGESPLTYLDTTRIMYGVLGGGWKGKLEKKHPGISVDSFLTLTIRVMNPLLVRETENRKSRFSDTVLLPEDSTASKRHVGHFTVDGRIVIKDNLPDDLYGGNHPFKGILIATSTKCSLYVFQVANNLFRLDTSIRGIVEMRRHLYGYGILTKREADLPEHAAELHPENGQ